MFRKKPGPDEIFRLAVRRRFRAEIDRARTGEGKEGRFPFEGGFRTLEEIARLRREMVRRDRRIFYELLGLFGVLTTIALLVAVVTWVILPW